MRDSETLWTEARALAQTAKTPDDLGEIQAWVDGLHPEEREILVNLYCERMKPLIRETRLTWEKLQTGLTQALARMMPALEVIMETWDLQAKLHGLTREEAIRETREALRQEGDPE